MFRRPVSRSQRISDIPICRLLAWRTWRTWRYGKGGWRGRKIGKGWDEKGGIDFPLDKIPTQLSIPRHFPSLATPTFSPPEKSVFGYATVCDDNKQRSTYTSCSRSFSITYSEMYHLWMCGFSRDQSVQADESSDRAHRSQMVRHLVSSLLIATRRYFRRHSLFTRNNSRISDLNSPTIAEQQ